MSNNDFNKLLEPGYIGKIKLKNRIIKTAQGSSVIEWDTGFIGERAKAYYEKLAQGGCGLLIVESCGVEFPLGIHHMPVQFHLEDDKYIPSYSELTRVIHKHGCPAFIQLIHSGPWNPTGHLIRPDARCSSPLTKETMPGADFVECMGMTLPEIEEVIEMFIKAAERAKKAGFEGVEVNAGTCTLLNSFLSLVFNTRTDSYGIGSMGDRARFVTEIISGIKKSCGEDFGVIVLLNIREYGHKKSTPLVEGLEFAKIFEKAGADAIQVRAHYYGHRGGLLHPDRFYYPELLQPKLEGLDWNKTGKAVILPLAVETKKVVQIPVFMAGRLDPILGERLLEEGKIDFVGMTRRLLADPELPKKVIEGRLEDIRPCFGCLHCMDVRLRNQLVTCRINAQLNRERELTYLPAKKKKRVMIIGAGPSGMEAARVAALRGHDVYLYDQQSKLGGLLPLAGMLKDIEVDEFIAVIRYFSIQLEKLGVTVKLGKPVDAAAVEELKPDVIIVAAGGKHTKPVIPGIEAARVVSSGDLHRQVKPFLNIFGPKRLEKLTKIWMPVGKKVVVIGARIQGCETAEFLIKRGRQVTMVDTSEIFGEGMTGDDLFQLAPWLDKKGVKRYLGVQFNSISKGKLNITTKEGQRVTLEADTIMTALPMSINNEIMKNMMGKAAEVYFVGDCPDPKLIAEASATGSTVGNTI
jgi:2,4-dienoyl-CoA reductase (NADPH2)